MKVKGPDQQATNMKGILFKPDMIKAIIEGRKTQTRRVIKPQPFLGDKFQNYEPLVGKPRYQVGEVVYIKEAGVWDERVRLFAYKANMPDLTAKWQSPRFMPAWAARYFIQITDVRAERLQEITEEDAIAEGCPSALVTLATVPMVEWYKHLWDSINPKYPWSSNPWVWVISFKKVEKCPTT